MVTVRVSGIAASAASLLMVGGKVVTMHREAHVMIHDPAVMAYGNGAKLRKRADDLDKIGATYASAYSRLTGNKIQMVRAWMTAETWMTADEALALNFCDRIEGDEQPVAVASFDYGMFLPVAHRAAGRVTWLKSQRKLSVYPAHFRVNIYT